jgi:heavy metal sensor kinase
MTRLPIRWRFTLWFGATLATVLVAFSLLLLLVMRHQLLASVDAELEEELREISGEIGSAKKTREMFARLHRGFAEHGDYYFEVTRPTGETLFQSKALEGQRVLAPEATSKIGSLQDGGLEFNSREVQGVGPSRVVSTNVEGPGGPYVVGAAKSLELFNRQLSLVTTVLVASIPVALVLALLGGYTLARRALSPIDRIVDVANRITATDLQQRVEAVNPTDELGRLSQTINSLIDRLQKAIEETRRFTADAAHELRTPLAVLRSGIEVALRSPRSAEDYRRALEAAVDESNRLAKLADQLLFLSRQDAGMTQIEREEVRLDALLKDVVDRFEIPAKESRLTLSIEPIEACSVCGDDVRLSQVFFNALDNAIKYTPQGGRITVRAHRAGPRVRVEVEDTGVGISPEHLGQVFKRFYRAEPQPNAARNGVGLGLAIAKSAVAAHGGEIWLESELGRGTVLSVELPLMAGTSPSNVQSSPQSAASA